jgi:hypothetical protein
MGGSSSFDRPSVSSTRSLHRSWSAYNSASVLRHGGQLGAFHYAHSVRVPDLLVQLREGQPDGLVVQRYLHLHPLWDCNSHGAVGTYLLQNVVRAESKRW